MYYMWLQDVLLTVTVTDFCFEYLIFDAVFWLFQLPAPEVRDNTGLIKNVVEGQVVHCITEAYIQARIYCKYIPKT